MKLKHIIAGGAMAAMTLFSSAATAETLKVGSTATGVPFTFLDVQTNKIQGLMVDVINAVGKEVDFEADVQAIDFASLIPSLTSDRIDLIAAAMMITPTREDVIDFSDPVVPYSEAIVVNTSFEGDISADFSELKGKIVGVQQGTIYLEKLQAVEGFGELRIYDSLADILAEVNRGRIDAGVGDRPIMAYQISQGNYPDAKLNAGYESQYIGQIGIGVSKNNPALLERVNSAVAILKDNGTIDEIMATWGVN